MIDKLLPAHISCRIKKIDTICEIRVRSGSKVVIYDRTNTMILIDYIVKESDIDYILTIASKGSLYTVNEMINKGFLIYDNGIRIGVMGEGVVEKDKLINIKNIRYLNIRIPKEIDIDLSKLALPDTPKNTLIISPPGAGKTTLLRALTKRYSNRGYNMLLVDERYEIASVKDGEPMLSVGSNTDIISGVSKILAYETAIRSMRPDVIVSDEIYSKAETDALIEASYCGIKMFATVHAPNIDYIANRTQVKDIVEVSEMIITLSTRPLLGTIANIEVK